MLALTTLIFVGVPVFLSANVWFSDDQVLNELRLDHPNVTKILKVKRCIFAKSIITVQENDRRHDYCLDTNMLQNYTFSECPKADKK